MRLQADSITGTLSYLRAATVLVLMSPVFSAHTQDLEPRAYTNTPVGMNFLLVGYQYSQGGLLFDPAVPITDADANVNMGLLGYVHTLAIADKSAKVGVLLPFAGLDANGYVEGSFRTREDQGLADPAFYFTINLYGAPALSFEEFKDYQQDMIIGLAFKLTAPLGVYEADKLLNIGTNRWSFKPEIGISQAIGRWTLDAAAAATLYTDNDEFDNGKTRQQDAIYSVQGHVVYTFPGNNYGPALALPITRVAARRLMVLQEMTCNRTGAPASPWHSRSTATTRSSYLATVVSAPEPVPTMTHSALHGNIAGAGVIKSGLYSGSRSCVSSFEPVCALTPDHQYGQHRIVAAGSRRCFLYRADYPHPHCRALTPPAVWSMQGLYRYLQ